MRRSKSNPAKYARNYRSISQRRMTEYDHLDEEKEMERLRQILRESEVKLQRSVAAHDDEGDVQDGNRKNQDEGHGSEQNKRKRKGRPQGGDLDSGKTPVQGDGLGLVLSKELQQEHEGYGVDDNELVLVSSKKKKQKKKQREVMLTPQEIRQAKVAQKNASRKLKQLATRAEQKKRRTELYAKLRETAISTEERELLASSSELGKRITKRETLQRLLHKERAGMELTAEERGQLYDTREVKEMDGTEGTDNGDGIGGDGAPRDEATKTGPAEQEKDDGNTNGQEATTPKKKKKKKKKKRKHDEGQIQKPDEAPASTEPIELEVPHKTPSAPETKHDAPKGSKTENDSENVSHPNNDIDNDDSTEEQKVNASDPEPAPSSGPPVVDFAAMMMASVSSLKTKIDEARVPTKEELPSSELERLANAEEKRTKKQAPYIPPKPVLLQTAATIGLDPTTTKTTTTNGRQASRVLPIHRPTAVETKRFDLPVSAMEYEIMDAIRNNDVTIICSETGSGKSTQVPQFLYEGGFTLDSGDNSNMLIGITQPRRVAAVSTAKRVCYEMGQGDGQSIRNNNNNNNSKKAKQTTQARKGGNLVCYQTRYETAGLGSDTRVKFMTDGILLQEIQSDLLLRKYSVIILDEAHERNLNTDVLLGMISVAIPLRKKAAAEEGSGLVPLKLVVMSATLRVEDFTENKKLFPTIPPAVVNVPGRTHSVTVHHSKVTELDDYETVAFKKVFAIHRKLPAGGVLVFLTGKQEILRMVKRLRSSLGGTSKKRRERIEQDVVPQDVSAGDNGLRDMDDDELDGEVIDNDDDNDDFSIEEELEEAYESLEYTPPNDDGDKDKIPKKVTVLPLYSMLSVEEQARVFAPVEEDHRLIVVATNIAETSITIPGVSYVVDSGRQKVRGFHSGTGMASYDVSWISKAAADQRAGRAGRTGPGHCYRLYSSTMYSRHMPDYPLPEVLTRPLEDVVLAMKAMRVSSVANFPFPTPPDHNQIEGAVKLLANLGCITMNPDEDDTMIDGGITNDGTISRLGAAVAKLPLGVRYGKMLLVAAQAGVLDYAIAMVAVLSEKSPFLHGQQDSMGDTDEKTEQEGKNDTDEEDESVKETKRERKSKWQHRNGDVLAGMLALGAYTYAGRGSGGASESAACRRFCEKNDLSYAVMVKIQKIRVHLARMAKMRLPNADGFAAKTGGIISSMKPPTKLQENLLCQSIVSGLLDQVAMLAPPGSLTEDHPYNLRSAYLSASSSIKEPLFLDTRGALFSRNPRLLPEWVCYDTLVRKKARDGTPVASMKRVTRIDASWLGPLAKGSRLLSLGDPLASRSPTYDPDKDAVLCHVQTKFGTKRWEVPPMQTPMYEALHPNDSAYKQKAQQGGVFRTDDSFRWFARFLLEGRVLPELKDLADYMNDDPALVTRKTPVAKVALLVSALSGAGVDSAGALRQHWAEQDKKFLFKHLKSWIKPSDAGSAKKLWMDTVKANVALWKQSKSAT